MTGAGIQPDDILVVDRAEPALDGDIIIARLYDELFIKRLRIRDGRTWLVPEHAVYEPLEIEDDMDFEVFGKVLHLIHTFHRKASA